MKKTKITTKALSMLLAAIMLFTTISVGIIVPDASIKANAAVDEQTANSIATLNAAIEAANDNGTGTVTKITLTGNIEYTNTSGTSVEAFETISKGNVILDLAGYSINIKVTKIGDYESGDASTQVPFENAGTMHQTADKITTAMINVSSGSTLQIYNSSTTESKISVYTSIDDSDDQKDTHHQTSSCVIYSEGTLILGETDGTKDKFDIYAHSSSRNNTGYTAARFAEKSASASAFAVTINGNSSVFKMYGGKVQATGVVRARRKGSTNLRVYALNIEACDTAEIYGGQINVPASPVDEYSGLRQSTDSVNTDNNNARISAIRCNTPYLYIFDVSSRVQSYTGSNTKEGSDPLRTSCIYVTTAENETTASKNAPYIYGGDFSLLNGRASGNSTTKNIGHIVDGSYKQSAGGSLTSSTLNTTPEQNPGAGSNGSDSLKKYTVFVGSGKTAENGIDMSSYASFRGYLSAYILATDGYFGDSSMNTNSGKMPAIGKYIRNGYIHSGWKGKIYPDGALAYSDTNDSGVAESGGSLFIEPVWEQTQYEIKFDLGDNKSYPVSDEVKNNYADLKYKIEEAKTIPVPERPGYTFTGWKAEHKAVLSTDNTISWNNAENFVYGYNSVTGESSSVSTGGQFGNITLVATWKPNTYRAEINYYTENDQSFYYKPYSQGEVFSATDVNGNKVSLADKFLSNPTRTEHHIFSGYYDVEGWNGTDKIYILDENKEPLSAGKLEEQFVGKYGNAVFTPHFDAKPYTITYYNDDYSLLETATYTFGLTDDLLSMPNAGRYFRGWQVRRSDNNTWRTEGDSVLNNIPAGAHGNVELIACYDYETYKYTVTFVGEDGTPIGEPVPYSYKDGYTKKILSPKPGYDIIGWTVVDMQSEEGDAAADWEDKDVKVENGVTIVAPGKTGSVTLKAKYQAKTYTMTFVSEDENIPAPAPETYDIENEVTFKTLSKTAYTFAGWKVVSCEGGNWDIGSVYSGIINRPGAEVRYYGDVTFVATWKAVDYTVTFDTDGGNFTAASGLTKTTVYNTNAVTNLTDYRNPNNISKDGYRFLGWIIKEYDNSVWDGFREIVADNKVIELPEGYYGNITLIADWEPITYTINFVFTDATPTVPLEPKTYTIEDTVTLPGVNEVTFTAMTLTGWELPVTTGGWAKNESYTPGQTFSNVWGNITLYAKAEPTKYTIQYIDDQGGILRSEEYTVKDTLDLFDYEKSGYITNGWFVSAEAGQNTGSWRTEVLYDHNSTYHGMYGNVKLYPSVTPRTYEVTLKNPDGTVLEIVSYDYETDKTLPSFEKTGFVLTGWQVTKADGNWTMNAITAPGATLNRKYGNVTLTAIWNEQSYPIRWENEDGSLIIEDNVKYGTLPVFSGETPKKADSDGYTYEFVGWSPEPQIVSGPASYKAVFVAKAKTFTVTWIHNSVTETTQFKYGEHPVFNDGEIPAAPDGMYFTGWMDENGNMLDGNTTVTADVTYTAQFAAKSADLYEIGWTTDGINYIYTYCKDGETPSYPGSPYLYTENGYIYKISGWNPKLEPATGPVNYTAYTSKEAIEYSAVFLPMGGQLSGGVIVSYNAEDGLVMPQPVKAGYVFKGWKVTVSDGGNWVADNTYSEAKYTGNYGEVRFEAQWEIETYTLTIKTATGEKTTEYNIESSDRLSLNSKEGYTHTGWLVYNSEENSNWKMGDVVEVNKLLSGMYGDVKLEPVWTANTYTISWISGEKTVTVEVKFGEEITSLAPAAKPGYTAMWDKEIPAVMEAGNLTFNALYTPVQYYLKYNTNGGNTIEGFYYDITFTTELELPVKEGSKFLGWKVSSGSGSWLKDGILYKDGMSLEGSYGDVSLTAVWEINMYDIVWKVGDVETVTSWYYGTRPYYNGIPQKPSDDSASYEFTGKWTDENGKLVDNTAIPVVTGPATYEAQFNAINRRYVISWDIDGTITTQTYIYGDAVICPFVGENIPTRPSTGEYDYTFSGWSPEITPVTGDVTYVAQFEKHIKIQGLAVDKSAVYIKVNESETITAIISPSAATNKDVEWVSLNRNIATVDENGRVVGVNAGETLVRVQSRDGKFKAYCMVNVTPVIAQYIVVSAAGISTTRLPGDAVQLYASIMPEDASNKVVKWTTSDPAVATVNANGLVVFGSTPGTATITATSDGYSSGSIVVTTTTDESAIKDNVKTYVIMFVQSSSSYIIGGQTFDSVTLICKEGSTLEFLLTEPHFVTLNATQFERDADGVYRIKDIRENYTVFATARPDVGFEEEPEEPGDNGGVKLSFFDRLKAFFRSIIEFFRNLFS